MNTILLQPTDVLFFRDGRPMTGSLAGHGAAWPLPNVTDAAFHAALHRSGLNGHPHDHRYHAERRGKDNRQFGSMVTAGPFPVHRASGRDIWYFPRPLDLMDGTLSPALMPTATFDPALSSLPEPLEYAVASRLPASKDTRSKAWLSAAAYQGYLDGSEPDLGQGDACDDSDFSDREATVGIALDAETGTTGQGDAAGKIYSARYLRLRDQWRLGVFAQTGEKASGSLERVDLIPGLLRHPHHLLVGGQRRLCTAELLPAGTSLPLPRGKTDRFTERDGKWLVKWILLSPAIWPEIPDQKPDGTPIQDKDGQPIQRHCGGWLPNWVRQNDGQVMLRAGEREHRSYVGKHRRGFGSDSAKIGARLVAATVPKPIVVTGWSLGVSAPESEPENPNSELLGAGAKSTHLAVPAGAVYYFEADFPKDAENLAAALNWHGRETSHIPDPNAECRMNRRSTLLGEKGFGLGVCATWNFHGTR